MTKQNLLKMLVDQRRIKELERLIPVKTKQISMARKDHYLYEKNRLQLNEYKLEYWERTGKEYLG